MSPKHHWDWSWAQAAGIFVEAIFDDLGGEAFMRRRLLSRADIVQKTSTAGGRQITWLEAPAKGAGIPVVLVHGTPGGALEWAPFFNDAAELRKTFTLIAVDRPGYGPLRGSLPNLEADMALLGQVLADVTGERKAVIVGQSLGGGVAARLAAEHPDKVQGLILTGSSLDPDLERVLPVQHKALEPPLKWLLTRSILCSNAELIQNVDFLWTLAPRLKNIACPVHAIHCRHDMLVPFANIDYMRRHFTNVESFTTTELELTGHFVTKLKPHILVQAIESYAY